MFDSRLKTQSISKSLNVGLEVLLSANCSFTRNLRDFSSRFLFPKINVCIEKHLIKSPCVWSNQSSIWNISVKLLHEDESSPHWVINFHTILQLISHSWDECVPWATWCIDSSRNYLSLSSFCLTIIAEQTNIEIPTNSSCEQ